MSVDFGCSLWPKVLPFHLGTAGRSLPKEGCVLQQAAFCVSAESMCCEGGGAAGPGMS